MHPPQDSELPRGGLVVVNGHKEKNGHLYTWGVRSSWVHPELEKKKLNTSFFEHPSRTSFWISKPDFFVKIFLFWTDFLLNIKWHFLNIHPNRTFLWTSKFPYLKKRLLCFRSGSRTSLWKTRAMKPRLNHKMNEQSEDEPSELPIITSPDIYIYVCVCVLPLIFTVGVFAGVARYGWNRNIVTSMCQIG